MTDRTTTTHANSTEASRTKEENTVTPSMTTPLVCQDRSVVEGQPAAKRVKCTMTNAGSYSASASGATATEEFSTKNPAIVEAHSLWSKQDIVSHILKFVGCGTFRFLAPISKTFHQSYKVVHNSTLTTYQEAITSIPWATQCLAESMKARTIMCQDAAEGGHLEVLQWARASGCNWDWQTCASAAKNGHLEVMKWARANGCDWDTKTCASAAEGGHLEVLKWARANGCDWDDRVLNLARQNKHSHVLEWVIANGAALPRY